MVRAMRTVGIADDLIIATVAQLDEGRQQKAREGNARRQQAWRERNANNALLPLRNGSNANNALSPLDKKERSSPTPPSKEKNSTPVGSVSNETLVPEGSGTLFERRKEQVELFQSVVGMWNDMAAGLKLVAVRDITHPRQAAIIARSADLTKTYDFPDALEGWRKLMGLVRASPFLRGEANGFRCDFDFLTRASSFTKIMEGKYEAQPKQAQQRRWR